MNNFEILKYEFITKNHSIDMKYVHWSRIYEWKYVIDELIKIKPNSIHNTACGGLNIGDCLHLTFCEDIENFSKNVTHSDVWGVGNYVGTENKPNKDNFIFYDITTSHSEKYDVVLNISTIEHLPKEKITTALNCLWDQVNDGGHFILTFDYPDIDINYMNNILNISPKNYAERIIERNLSVILLHLLKKTEL